MQNIGIIGVGTMGNGIAHVSALSGFTTFLLDLNEDYLQRGLKTIESNLQRHLKKGKISDIYTQSFIFGILNGLASVTKLV